MSTIAFDQFTLTRIADFARSLSRLHQASRRQPVDVRRRDFGTVATQVGISEIVSQDHDDTGALRRLCGPCDTNAGRHQQQAA